MKHAPASYIADKVGLSRQRVYQLAAEHGVNYIEPFRQMRQYDLKDWCKKIQKYPLDNCKQ